MYLQCLFLLIHKTEWRPSCPAFGEFDVELSALLLLDFLDFFFFFFFCAVAV